MATQQERLATLETEIKHISQSINEIKELMIKGSTITEDNKDEVTEELKAINKRIDSLSIQRLVGGGLAMLAGAVLHYVGVSPEKIAVIVKTIGGAAS